MRPTVLGSVLAWGLSLGLALGGAGCLLLSQPAVTLGESQLEVTVIAGSQPTFYSVPVRYDAGSVSITPDFSEQPSWLLAVIEPSGEDGRGNAELRLNLYPDHMVIGPQSASLKVVATTGASADFLLTAIMRPAFRVVPNMLSVTANDGKNASVQFTIESHPAGVYPFTIAPIAGLSFSSLTGVTGELITVGPDPAAAGDPAATTTHPIDVDVTAVGDVAHTVGSLTLRHLPRVLHVPRNGLALVDGPGVSRRTDSFTVVDVAAQQAAFTVVSDRSWLRASRSGMSVTVEADPTGLAPGQHIANVAITSTDPAIASGDTVRVGLYVFETAPSTEPIPFFGHELAVDPIRPLLYHIEGDVIRAYNLYTNAVAFEVALGLSQGDPAALVTDLDGRRLYVGVVNTTDKSNIRIVDLDTQLLGGALSNPDPTGFCADEMIYLRVRGVGVVADGCLNSWIAESGRYKPVGQLINPVPFLLGYHGNEIVGPDSYCELGAFEYDVTDESMSRNLVMPKPTRMLLDDCNGSTANRMQFVRASRDGTVVVAQALMASTTWRRGEDGEFYKTGAVVSSGARDVIPLDDGRVYVAPNDLHVVGELVSADGAQREPFDIGIWPLRIALSSDGKRLFIDGFNAMLQRGEARVLPAIHSRAPAAATRRSR